MSGPQSTFQILKPVCIRLSQVSAILRAGASNFDQVRAATTDLLRTLEGIRASPLHLDARLAEYVFLPLSNLFFERSRLPDNILELSLKCLNQILSTGWHDKIDGDLALQLVMLLTFFAEDSNSKKREGSKPKSEEMQQSAFKGLDLVCRSVHRSPDAVTKLIESSHLPALAKTVLVTAETSRDSQSVDVQSSALDALYSLILCISDRQVLARFLPGIVSALTQLLTPGTKQNKHYKVLMKAIETLRLVLSTVLADETVFPLPTGHQAELGESWLKATSAQVKMGLANVYRLCRHGRAEVRAELAELCFALLDACQLSLADSIESTLETLLLLVQDDDDGRERLLDRLKPIMRDNVEIEELLRSNVYRWSSELPIIMLSNDDTKRKVSLGRVQSGLQLLKASNADVSSICRSLQPTFYEILETQMKHPQNGKEKTVVGNDARIVPFGLEMMRKNSTAAPSFPRIVFTTQSSQEDSSSIMRIVNELSATSYAPEIIADSLDLARTSTAETQVASFWLAFNMLRSHHESELSQAEFLNFDTNGVSETAFDDLYSFALEILRQHEDPSLTPWYAQALALEAITLQSYRLGEDFRPEFVDSLYPIIHFLGSPNTILQSHATIALDSIALHTGYDSSKDLIVQNSDYLVNAIGAKLNAYDLEPQVPTVMKMLVKLCGSSVVPYLDDLVDGTFDVLDKFHGYPTLVEHVFGALTATVEEAVTTKAFTKTYEVARDHRKPSKNPELVDSTADWLRSRRKRQLDAMAKTAAALPEQTPHEPWKHPSNDTENAFETSPPSVENKVAPLSQTYKTTLNIAKHAISHLTSPSPSTRASLLHLQQTAIPFLAQHEDSFLPFVNEVWPSLLYRLRDEENFVVCQSIIVMTQIAKSAGDFMATRFASSWSEFARLWKTATHIPGHADPSPMSGRRADKKSKFSGGVSSRDLASIMSSPGQQAESRNFRGDGSGTLSIATSTRAAKSENTAYTPTTLKRLRSDLIDLFTTLMTHVRLSDDMASDIELWLSPIATEGLSTLESTTEIAHVKSDVAISTAEKSDADAKKIVEALASRNPDAFWYSQEKEKWKGSDKRKEEWAAALPAQIDDAPNWRCVIFA